jgi:maleamate amidohydrolase
MVPLGGIVRLAAQEITPVDRGVTRRGMPERSWDGFVTEQDKHVYQLGGFGRPGELGKRPAIVMIDVVYHSVGDRPEPIVESVKKYPASCGENGWRAVEQIAKLLEVARANGVPIVYAVPVERTKDSEYGRYLDKMTAVAKRQQIGGHDSIDIVEEVAPQPGDRIIRKPKSSAFFKTNLKETLDELGADSILITGCTTSGCVRLTAADAFQYDLKAAVIEECVYDRGQASHAVSLWDMNAKYADVISLENALAHLNNLARHQGLPPNRAGLPLAPPARRTGR